MVYRSVSDGNYDNILKNGLVPDWQFSAEDAEHYQIDGSKSYIYMAPNRQAAEKYGSHSSSLVMRFKPPADAKLVNMGYYISTKSILPQKIQILLDTPWDDNENWLPVQKTMWDASRGFIPKSKM